MVINWFVRVLLAVIAVSAFLMLSGCGDKRNPDHYSGTGMFQIDTPTLGTPACGGGDVCKNQ